MKGFKLTPASIEKRSLTNLCDPILELTDPNPDVHQLFRDFDQEFFYSTLGKVELKFSKAMTVCAGVCRYRRGHISIGLSEPLLKLRSRADLVETLLHEMIHAYIFVKGNFNEGHGSIFKSHMNRINKAAGTNITIYHTWNGEVRSLKTHWWRCQGKCRDWKPYFGYVKRSRNRAPSKHDKWFEAHRLSCGGQFLKVKEPENFRKGQKGLKKMMNHPLKGFKLNDTKNNQPKISYFVDDTQNSPSDCEIMDAPEPELHKQVDSTKIIYDFDDPKFQASDLESSNNSDILEVTETVPANAKTNQISYEFEDSDNDLEFVSICTCPTMSKDTESAITYDLNDPKFQTAINFSDSEDDLFFIEHTQILPGPLTTPKNSQKPPTTKISYEFSDDDINLIEPSPDSTSKKPEFSEDVDDCVFFEVDKISYRFSDDLDESVLFVP